MKTPKLKSKSAITGRYTQAKGADPKTTFTSDDYPARALRKLVRMLETEEFYDHHLVSDDTHKLIASIKRRMGWR